MRLVETWLRGINLDYAPFAAAGFNSPEALAGLDPSCFDALGVTKAEDRRKLFYLIQRVRLSMSNIQFSSNVAADRVDAVLAQSMPTTTMAAGEPSSPTSSRSLPLHRRASAFSSQEDEPSEEGGYGQDAEDDADVAALDYFDEPNEDPNDSDWEPEQEDNSSGGVSADDELSSVPPQSPPRPPPPGPANGRPHAAAPNKKSLMATPASRRSSLNRPLATTNNRWSMMSTTGTVAAAMLTEPNSRRSMAPAASGGHARQAVGVKHHDARHSRRKSESAAVLTDSSDNSYNSRPTASRRLSGLPVPPSNAVNKGLWAAAATAKSASYPATKRTTGKFGPSVPTMTPMSPLVEQLDHLATTAYDDDSDEALPAASGQQQQSDAYSATLTENEAPLERSEDDSDALFGNTAGKRDQSFQAQIAQLRLRRQAEHERRYGTTTVPFDDCDDGMRIRVIVRKRPMSRAEIAAAGDVDIMHPLDCVTFGKMLVYQPRTRVDLTKHIEAVSFAFDAVFNENATNVEIYSRSVRSLIPTLFDGQWASIFAYGQTGSGKTYTMLGSNSTTAAAGNALSSNYSSSNLGLYYMAALDVFAVLRTPGYEHFHVAMSLFEIYGGKLYDLLSARSQIKCLEDSRGHVCFPGLSEHALNGPEALMRLMEQGAVHRSTGTTSRNADSSRSHAVLQLHLRNGQREHSRLSFIDLAGSERGADTSSASRATRMEGAEINASLLALKEVIRALATGNTVGHVPFRGSKLTQVLKESFIGKNCRSVMIACISPNIGNCEQSLNTLRYADRVKERNAVTGQVTAVTECEGTALSVIRPPLATTAVKPPSRRVDSNTSLDSGTSDMLNDLLASPEPPVRKALGAVAVSSDDGETPQSPIDDVVSVHKDAISTLLAMVNDEMALVHETEHSDRDGLEDYIARLLDMQSQQLELFGFIRDCIRHYREMRGPGPLLHDDDSVEDLRD